MVGRIGLQKRPVLRFVWIAVFRDQLAPASSLTHLLTSGVIILVVKAASPAATQRKSIREVIWVKPHTGTLTSIPFSEVIRRDRPTHVRKLLFLFGLIYFAQSIGQSGGLIAQPLQFFFKQRLGFNPAQTTEYLAIVTIPWMVKPLYGVVSDLIPLLGYRRKTCPH